ncbi:MAG: hypothetical protein ACFFDB_11595 [Promethearchaeota archaeon]
MLDSLIELGWGSKLTQNLLRNQRKQKTKIIMCSENFNFTSRTRCRHCGTRMLVMDNKIQFCPLCELKIREKYSELEKKERFVKSFVKFAPNCSN